MHITAQGFRLRNDLYCVEWDVKLYYTISMPTRPRRDLGRRLNVSRDQDIETKTTVISVISILKTYCIGT